jgi:hypothetical protein
VVVDTHVHVFTDDRKNYPQIRDTPRGIDTEHHRDRSDGVAGDDGGDVISLMDEAGIDKATLVQAYFVYEYRRTRSSAASKRAATKRRRSSPS